jgi:hypothetical protein
MTDVDFYRFRPVAGRNQVTVRLQAAGISLLKATLEVYDNRGNRIADVKADSILENNLQITLSSLQQGQDYFVRVARNSGDVFAVGDYQLELDYRAPSQQPSIVPPQFDADASDEDDAIVDYVSVDRLFSNGLVSNEFRTNDTLPSATRLETVPGFLAGTRYEAIASLSQAADRDLYRFRTPSTASGLLNIDLNPLGQTPISPNVIVMPNACQPRATIASAPLGDQPANCVQAFGSSTSGGATSARLEPSICDTIARIVRTLAWRPPGRFVCSSVYPINDFTSPGSSPVASMTQASINKTGRQLLILIDIFTQLKWKR